MMFPNTGLRKLLSGKQGFLVASLCRGFSVLSEGTKKSWLFPEPQPSETSVPGTAQESGESLVFSRTLQSDSTR